MPLTVRLLAFSTALLWAWMLIAAPSSAPFYHPVGIDWLVVISCLLAAPTLLVIALVPNSKGGY